MDLTSKKTGGKMMVVGVLGFVTSVAAFIAWPMLLLAMMVGFDFEPSGEWDGPTVLANIGNLVVFGGATICICLSPTIAMAGAVIYAIAHGRERASRD